MYRFSTRAFRALGSRKLAGTAETLLAQNVVLFEVGVRFLGETFEKVPPITPSKLSKRKFWESNIGRACAPPRSFTDGICQFVHRRSTRTAGSLGCRERLGTAETLSAQRVVLREVGSLVAFPLRGRKQPQAVG